MTSSTMKPAASYGDKLERIETETLVPHLAPGTRSFVRRLAETHRFTLQELRRVAVAARDLEMWREPPLEEWWPAAARGFRLEGRDLKKALLRSLERHLEELVRSEKVYPTPPLRGAPRRSIRLVESESPTTVFGRCPAYSEKTVCCRLHTVDAAAGCAFGCSYCTIQTFYGDRAELRSDLARKLAQLELDPGRFYHIGTGQSSDSLVWGNRGGTLEALLDFAARHPQVLLELKTKSDNVGFLLERSLLGKVPANVVCSWSLSTETLIRNEEHGTASLDRRLRAARAVADRGIPVGFHFHPMIRYRGWREEYGKLVGRLLQEFAGEEIAFVSMGSPTFIRPVIQEIRRRGGETKILQMEMVTDPHGKLTYPDQVKIELYRFLHGALRPWHSDALFYLCMETAAMWEAVLERSYESNEAFEQAFARATLPAGWPRAGA